MDYTISSHVVIHLHRPNGAMIRFEVPWFGAAYDSELIQIYNWYRKLYKVNRDYNGRLELVSVQYCVPYELNMLQFWQGLKLAASKEMQRTVKVRLYEDLLYEKILLKRKLDA